MLVAAQVLPCPRCRRMTVYDPETRRFAAHRPCQYRVPRQTFDDEPLEQALSLWEDTDELEERHG